MRFDVTIVADSTGPNGALSSSRLFTNLDRAHEALGRGADLPGFSRLTLPDRYRKHDHAFGWSVFGGTKWG
jgi:hypothetical protein